MLIILSFAKQLASKVNLITIVSFIERNFV